MQKQIAGIEKAANELLTAHNAVKRLFSFYQLPVESNNDYFDRFRLVWQAAVAAAGESNLIPTIAQNSSKYKGMSKEQVVEATKYMFVFFHSDKIRYEQVVLGEDRYPITVEGTYKILSDMHRRLEEYRVRKGGGKMSGLSFY